MMATPVKKWLLRVAPWFLPVGIVAVWQLAGVDWLFNWRIAGINSGAD